MPYGRPMTAPRVPGWVRWGTLVLLAVPQLVVGVWGVLAPRRWYEDFPGVGPDLVAALPPFNEHLAADAAGGFLATGIGLTAAVIWPRRDLVLLALAVFVAFAVPHAVYHTANEAPGLAGAEEIANAGSLWWQVVASSVLAWGAWRTATPPVVVATSDVPATAVPGAREPH